MIGRAIMVQGTGSDVGKSVFVAGLCWIAKRRGLKVAPFKPQNMSNNAAACADGGEIGRAQALQARACALDPQVDFNPVLLKPQSDKMAQVVVHGRALNTQTAAEYMSRRDMLMGAVETSFTRLTNTYDLVIVEGAGSPAEVNLRARDIANMGFARRLGVPVILLGDIDRGGVIASLVGTKAVIDPEDAAMICGFAINKFRGDISLFEDGIKAIEERTDWPCLGVVPWLKAVARLPAEDAVVLDRATGRKDGKLRISAPMLSRMANFDDADPLKAEPNVDFAFIPPGKAIPRDSDVIILFGTKSTLADMAFLKEQGWDHDIIAHARAGGRVLGICGGFQMLGRTLKDPDQVDGGISDIDGLGLLDVETVMTPDKQVRPVFGRHVMSKSEVSGYEIHAGRTSGQDMARPFLELKHGPDGACSANGLIEGTYVHGLFSSDLFRQRWLNDIREDVASDGLAFEAEVDQALDDLADGLETALDIDQLFGNARAPGWAPHLG